MQRRTLLRAGVGALGAAWAARGAWIRELEAAGLRFRYSICNEVFEKWDFARSCAAIKAAGFAGIEIAPFTLDDDPAALTAARRRELAGIIRSEGLQFAGLHWLLITPKWLHVSTADRSIRERSWSYFKKLIDLCADLGDRGVMVLGSPKQRGSQGNSRAEATALLKAGLQSVAAHAADRGVVIALEPLASKDTDVVNTVAEAAGIIAEINHRAIRTMFDFHNTADEREPFEALVRRHFGVIRHIHVNEMDGRYPGTGSFDFRPVFQTLAELKYAHWVSLEVFDFKPGPVEIARASMDYFTKLEARLKS